MTLDLVIPGPPRGKGRPRFSRVSGRVYTDEKTVKYESHVRKCGLAVMAGRRPLEGAVNVRIVAFFTPPSSATKEVHAAMLENALRPITKTDADNIAKAVLDGLNGVLFADDKQVCGLVVEKRYAEQARVEVSVWKPKGILQWLEQKLLGAKKRLLR